MKTNWQTKKLGGVLKLEYGKPLPKSHRKSDGLYPVYGANGVKSFSDKFYCDKPSIIVGRKGSAGEINLTEKKFWPLDVTYFVTFDDKKYDLKFLYNFLAILEIPKLAKGVKPGINRNEVYDIDVKIPPLSEQHRIVKILDGVFGDVKKAKEKAEKNLANAKELFESYLQSVFANPGKDWEEKKLGEVCEIVNGGTPDTKVLKYWDGDNLWITPKDMGKLKDVYVSDTIRKISNFGLENSSAKLLPINSVILSSRAPIGHLIINKKEMATNQGCKGIIPCDKLETLFLYYFLKSSVKLLNDLGSGTTFKELSGSKLAEVIIFVPKLSIQKQIVKKLDELSAQTKKLEDIYQQKIDDLEELKKSVLEKAFSGDL